MEQQNQDNSFNGSPRRRKAQLDLDAALYLQSQASLVQEPNKSSSSQQRKQATSYPATGFSADCANQENLFNYSNYNTNSSISVDYIDCISNHDLKPQQTFSPNFSSLNQSNSALDMVNCRKLSRFHRNRVDPRRLEQASRQAGDSTSSNNLNNSLTSSSVDQDSVGPASELTGSANGNGAKATAATPSCLYPISVNEVKERTYFIGQLNHDSLLGHDELHRYFPNGRVNIYVCTWNQNRRRSPMNLNDLLLPEKLEYMPDIYAVGIQEAFSYQSDYLREWEIELQTTLGPNHVLLHSCSLGVLHLCIFIRRDLIWFCSIPEESLYNSRSMPTNMLKTKGAVSIAFRFFGTISL